MALGKTYLLAPNFTFRPDGPIALGNIIADPFAPHRVLTAPDPDKAPPAVEATVEHDYTVHRNAGRRREPGISAQFLETVGGNVGTDYSKSTSTEYTMSSLKTIYYRNEPDEEEIRLRVNVPKVKNVMRFGSVRSRPVYMITGIKIAEDLAATTERSIQEGGNVGASAPVVDGISVGANVALSREDGQRDSFRSGNDVVRVPVAGDWVEKLEGETLKANEFKLKANFVGDAEEKESDVEAEASAATAETLLKYDRKDVPLEMNEIQDRE